MSTVAVYDMQGKRTGEVALPAPLTGKPHTVVLYEALVWQLAGRRRGTHATKTRGMVARSTRKLYRQKGTGRARHGGRGAPLFVGGGIAFGPRPRSYAFRLPKRIRRMALRSALAAKAEAGRFAVLDRLSLEQPKTRMLAGLIREIGGSGAFERHAAVLLITAGPEPAVTRAAANLPSLRVLPATALNVHDILACEYLLVTQDALARITEAFAE
jgi:large subunit ribosomal protein L4